MFLLLEELPPQEASVCETVLFLVEATVFFCSKQVFRLLEACVVIVQRATRAALLSGVRAEHSGPAAPLYTSSLLSSVRHRYGNAGSGGTRLKSCLSTSRSSSPFPPSTGFGGAAIAGWAARMCSRFPSSTSSCRRGMVRQGRLDAFYDRRYCTYFWRKYF